MLGVLRPGLRRATAIVAAVVITSLLNPAAQADRPREPRKLPGEMSSADEGAFDALPGDSLAIQISEVTPSVLSPQTTGRVTISGLIRNTGSKPWRNISLYPLISPTPITDDVALAAAIESDPVLPIGERITRPGNFTKVGALVPGQQTAFTIQVRRSALQVSAPGVYWLGVQALGENERGRDGIAEGRARVLLPFMPRNAKPVDTALVVPVRTPITFAGSGRIADAADWLAALSEGGQLSQTVELGKLPGGNQVTWVVDPAVIWAVSHLALGNPARSFGAYVPDSEEIPDDTSSGSPTGDDPSTGDSASGSVAGGEDPANLAGRANDWLVDAEVLTSRGQLLGLPFADPDLTETAFSSGIFDLATERSAELLTNSTAAVMPPSGLVSSGVLEKLPAGTTILAGDIMAPEVERPVFKVGEHTMVITGDVSAPDKPGEAATGLGSRQQLLGRVALRQLNKDRTPLVVSLGASWQTRPKAFLEGLNPRHVKLRRLTELSESVPTLDREVLEFPDDQRATEIPVENFAAAQGLLDSATEADSLIRGENLDLTRLEAQALNTVGVAHRSDASAVFASTQRATRLLDQTLDRIVVKAPTSLRLLSDRGKFSAVVANNTNLPVRVKVTAVSTVEGVRVTGGREVSLQPNKHRTVRFRVTSQQVGFSQVVVSAQNLDGLPVGTNDIVPVRSTQVSNTLWVIIGVGLSLLLLAILVRFVRRLRHYLHQRSLASQADAGTAESGAPQTEQATEDADSEATSV